MLVASSVVAKRTGIATPLLLLVVGIVASLIPSIPNIRLEPDWILMGVLPPLLYSSSVRLPVTDLRRNLSSIVWLSAVVVIVTALGLGWLIHALFPQIPLAAAIALAAVVAPTDAVAATAIGKRLGMPHRLMTLLEGESLFNDASALTILRTAIAAISGGFSLAEAGLDFVWAVIGAIIAGYLVGRVSVWLRSRLSDPVVSATVSFLVPFMAYLPAEEVHASGVVAVVVAGLVTGHQAPRLLSSQDRQTERITWSTVNFIMENAVFFLMGMQLTELVKGVRGETSWTMVIELTALVFVGLMVLRFLAVGAMVNIEKFNPSRVAKGRARNAEIAERLDEIEAESDSDNDRLAWARRRVDRSQADLDVMEAERLSRRGGVVLSWAGMRGVVTLAAALTIPAGTAQRDTLVLVAFLVAVATLLIFGLSLPPVIRAMHFTKKTPREEVAALRALMHDLVDRAGETVGPVKALTVSGKPVDPKIADLVSERFAPILRGGSLDPDKTNPDLHQQMIAVTTIYLDAMRDALLEERGIGAYSAATLSRAQAILDREFAGIARLN